jgi:hypothetical protein
MISSRITIASAIVLFVGGLALLFAPDIVLGRLVPGFPPGAAWIGSLLGAAWLGVAALNWLHRTTLLGGIYGRPVVYPNFVLFLVSALVLVRVVLRPGMPAVIWLFAAPFFVLAVVYALLLFRGPFDPLDRA